MRGDAIHHEESPASKVALVRLLLFFMNYFAPYKKAVAVTMLLALLVIATELLLPQLLRSALDRFIAPAARMVAEQPGRAAAARLQSMDRRLFLPSGRPGCYFILPEQLRRLGDAEIKLMENSGQLLPEKYYAAPADAITDAVAAKYPALFQQAGAFNLIAYDKLGVLEKPDLMSLRKHDLQGLSGICLAFIAILSTGFILNFMQIFLVERTSQRIMHDLRCSIFSHLQGRAMSFFTKNPVGRLVTRATSDVQNLHEMFSALFSSIFKDIFLILGIMAALFILSWKLSLVCFCLLPLLIAGAAAFSYTSHNAFREVRLKIAALNSMIQENLAGITVVKAFCREWRTAAQFSRVNLETYRANMKQTVVFAIFTPLVDFTRVCAFALIIWYGGGQTLREAISIGTLVIFLYYMRMFFTPIQDLAEKYNIVQSACASLERLYLLFEEKAVIADSPDALPPGTLAGAVEFRNVTFAYNLHETVLHDISFTVNPGETVAIVGLTGAGKTTIINLLERFYDVQAGSILIDSRDIRTMPQAFLRRSIGLVLQDVFLFAGTIRSNITLGCAGFTDEQILQALAIANADRLVAKLPGGLDEMVTEGGKTLSAGERQLLSFARAVLIDPKILVLDEATSNIDPVTEGLIQDALDKILRGRTCIVIAHRFSTIKKADRIIVLHRGKVAETGSHDELMAASILYKQLYELQYKQ
ncbi:MAG: ABC transporter ATP-binding protein [Deltaproteobacteria bacterium]|nr:ABC transporter ATP-binding protein [Deltaproteobacteria bacterium]